MSKTYCCGCLALSSGVGFGFGGGCFLGSSGLLWGSGFGGGLLGCGSLFGGGSFSSSSLLHQGMVSIPVDATGSCDVLLAYLWSSGLCGRCSRLRATILLRKLHRARSTWEGAC